MADKILFIEPHEDDALFSISSLLCCNSLDKTLMSVSCRNENESAKLPNFIPNLRVFTYSVPDYDYSLRISREDSKYFRYEDLVRYYAGRFANTEELWTALDVNFDQYDFVFAPFGIEHPFHILVAEELKKKRLPNLFFYLDFPYWTKKRNQRVFLPEIEKFKRIEFSPFPKKLSLFAKVYPTQTGFLRYYSRPMMKYEFILTEKGNVRLPNRNSLI